LGVLTRAQFEDAVRAYRFADIALDPAALGAARETLDATGLLVVGEPHGMYETPAVAYALARALDTRAIAFEWSHEEMRVLDLERLWSLPATSEFFSGDGRITAGHFALIDRLRSEGRLGQVIAFDRVDATPPVSWEEHVRVRDRQMAERLLQEWDRSFPLLVLTGGFHAQLSPAEGEPMAAHLARALPGLQPAMFAYEGVPMPPAPIVFSLPPGRPAVTPTPPAA
jgi:hypothetical protein